MFPLLIRQIIFQSQAFHARAQFGVGPRQPTNHKAASGKQQLLEAFVLYYDQLIE